MWKEEDLGHAVKEFIKEEIKVEIRVEKARKIKLKRNEEMVVAELGNWDEKREVMRKKKTPKQGIYIDEDLTREERLIQRGC